MRVESVGVAGWCDNVKSLSKINEKMIQKKKKRGQCIITQHNARLYVC